MRWKQTLSAVLAAGTMFFSGNKINEGFNLEQMVNQVTAPASAEAKQNIYIKHFLRKGKVSYSSPKWEQINPGLSFTKIEVRKGKDLVDTVAIVKTNPKDYRFQYFHEYDAPKTITEWQEKTKATVILNSAYYCYFCVSPKKIKHPKAIPYEDTRLGYQCWALDSYENKCPQTLDKMLYNAPCGTSFSQGKLIRSKTLAGMFVSELKDEWKNKGLPRTGILDLSREKHDYNNFPWREGVQGSPILLDEKGRVRTRPTKWQANRTAMAVDKQGNILILKTEGGYFTLHDFGQFLKKSGLGIKIALNMDGGYESELMVKTPSFDYLGWGQWETQGTKNDISIPGVHYQIPAVIGVFPREK